MKTTSVSWRPVPQAPGGIVQGLDDVQRATQVILRIPRGSDPHRPELGSNLHFYIDWPVDRATPYVVCESVDAIRHWEPRCRFMSVKPAVDDRHPTLRMSWEGSDGRTRAQELLWRRQNPILLNMMSTKSR